MWFAFPRVPSSFSRDPPGVTFATCFLARAGGPADEAMGASRWGRGDHHGGGDSFVGCGNPHTLWAIHKFMVRNELNGALAIRARATAILRERFETNARQGGQTGAT